MSHLQSELAETKVGLLMVKAEEAAEKDATDVLIRTILSIVSVGEMTETRHSAVEALTAIKASRATREDWKKDTANTPPREKRRGSPASTPTSTFVQYRNESPRHAAGQQEVSREPG